MYAFVPGINECVAHAGEVTVIEVGGGEHKFSRFDDRLRLTLGHLVHSADRRRSRRLSQCVAREDGAGGEGGGSVGNEVATVHAELGHEVQTKRTAVDHGGGWRRADVDPAAVRQIGRMAFHSSAATDGSLSGANRKAAAPPIWGVTAWREPQDRPVVQPSEEGPLAERGE